MPDASARPHLRAHFFTRENARAASLKGVPKRIAAVRLKILKRSIAGQKAARHTISGPKLRAIIAQTADRIQSVEAKLARLEAERARLDASPSRAEYVLAGVERHLGRALLPSAQVLKRRIARNQTPAIEPAPPTTTTTMPEARAPEFDPTTKPAPKRARPSAAKASEGVPPTTPA